MDSMPIKLEEVFDPLDQPYHPRNLQFPYLSFGKTILSSGVARTSRLLGHSMHTTFVRTSAQSAEAYRGVWGHPPHRKFRDFTSLAKPD